MSKESFKNIKWIILVFSCVLFSCKTTKKITASAVNTSVSEVKDTADEKCKLDYKSSKTIERLMRQNELDFYTFSGKINCLLKSNDEENSFNISVRCRKDSAIWLNVSKMGLDALRMLVLRDSVKFMVMTSLGGMDKGYFKGDYSFINQALKADLDYEMLQSLLIGNSTEFLNDSIRLKGGKDKENCLYYLSTIRRRKLSKINEGKQPRENLQAIWLNPISWKIILLQFIDIESSRKFTASYSDFQVSGNSSIPVKQIYTINAEKKINAELNWTKFTINEPLSFPYKVPNTYEEIKLIYKKE